MFGGDNTITWSASYGSRSPYEEMISKYSSHLDNQDVTITLMRKLPDKGLKRKWVDRVPLKCPQCSGPHGVWRCWIFRSSSLRDHLKTVRQHSVAWRCISPWSFHRSPQRRREMDIFGNISRFPRILSKTNPKKKRKPQLNAQKHWESKSKRLQLVSGSNTCKTQSPQQQFVRLARKSLQSRDFELLSIPQYRKRNRHFITINFQNLAFLRESFTCSNVIFALSLEIYFPWQ